MEEPIKRLPQTGTDKQELLRMMKEFGAGDADWREARTWSLVYFLGEEHNNFIKKAYSLFFSENALNPMAFRSLKRFESEIVRMTATMLNGDSRVVGTITSGGTESCLLAVKAYRDLARERRPWIRKPEMVVPESVHVAWEKAAEYFDVKSVHAPLAKDFQVDVDAVRKLINRNTILIGASAPSYPHGMVDPIPGLSALAQEKNLPLHVDSCLGGFLLPFVEKLGYPVPAFDFRVPGVTSISADVHKYGFAAKGASVILYRDMRILKHQFFVYENWPGGIFISPALLGTRPGGAIAAAWAAMMAIGESGYLDNARLIMDITRKLIDGVSAIPELYVLGEPHMSVFAYASRSKAVNIYAVADQMEKKGWQIDRLHRPEALHAIVIPAHEKILEQYLGDLRESVDYVKKNPELAEQGGAAMYGMISQVPLRGMVKRNVLKIMEDMYGPEARLPEFDGSEETEEAPTDLATRIALRYLKMRNRLMK
ncbi:MAG: aminotransferase class V-fold PLP-dependent enzyme [Candidatus Eisenbacteria bacterium]